MFDRVTACYDLLNSLMTLGQDAAWRAALAGAVPAAAHDVLDLCTGNGISLVGLQRPGRRVIGIDVSLGMLESAAAALPDQGWAPRLVCADAFRLPLPDAAVDAITIGFGMRNLRPRAAALAEIRRVLRPGGTLAVLEATAPRPGLLGAFHAFHLRVVLPLLGRLSPEPAAYRYLSESIFEFGDGAAFERDLAAAGFEIASGRRFLLGASGLWTAQVPGGPSPPAPGHVAAGAGEIPTAPATAVQNAWAGAPRRAESPARSGAWEREWRAWMLVQALLAAALTAALAWGAVEFAKYRPGLPLNPWQERALWFLLLGGGLGFLARTLLLVLRLSGPARRR